MPITIVGARETAASFRAGAVEIEGRLRHAMSDHGQLVQSAVRAHAHGRPGPNVVTGAYVNSIGYVVSGSGANVSVEIGSDLPYGRRLEFGFHGVDSWGRSYNSPALPHFEPAVDETMDSLALGLALIVATV